MRNTTKKKRGPIICAIVVVVFLAAVLATIIFPLLNEVYGETIVIGFLAIYAGMIVAVIVGVLAALRQRLKEIEGGEEEDAKKY